MGLFDAFRKNNNTEPEVVVETSGDVNPQLNINKNTQLLNLQKGDVLDLTKCADSLNAVRAAAGWDVSRNAKSYDLDLCAYLCDKDGDIEHVVYYGDKDSYTSKGIYLDKDDLTGGSSDGDDENIFVTLNKIPDKIKSIYFAVVIYEASYKSQSFGEVKNAYVRLVNTEQNDKEICRYNLSDNTGGDTAVIAAKLTRGSNGWLFAPIGEYSKNSIKSLKKEIVKFSKKG